MGPLTAQTRRALAEFTGQLQAISANQDYSESGRQKLRAKVAQAAAAYQAQALADLKFWDKHYQDKLSELRQREAAAREAEAASWDFQRLAHERGRVKDLLNGAQTLGDLRRAYERAKTSGDRYQVRAFEDLPNFLMSDSAANLTNGVGLPGKGERGASGQTALERVTLARMIENDVAEIRALPAEERAAIDESARVLAFGVKEHLAELQAAHSFFSSGGDPQDFFNRARVTEFSALLRNWRIDEPTDNAPARVAYAEPAPDDGARGGVYTPARYSVGG